MTLVRVVSFDRNLISITLVIFKSILINRDKMPRYKMLCLDAMILLAVSNIMLHLCLDASEQLKTENVNEYCQSESFQPRCPNSKVILMRSATYGRMRVGRCITAEEIDAQRSLTKDDPRILGCSSDILPLLDKKCSGNSECDVRVFDIGSDIVRPCVVGLNVYLEASFSCIKVADERRSCTVTVSSDPTHIVLLTSIAPQRLCGTNTKPWIVEAPLGQRINISLLHFPSSLSIQRERRPCHQHGTIIEKSMKITTPICNNDERREKELYQSKGNSLEIIFNDREQMENGSENEKLILQLQAVGCSDILPPEDMWLRRNDDSITIGCYSNRQMWRLHCKRSQWTGVIGNCTNYEPKVEFVVNTSEEETSLSESEQVLSIVAICGFTVAICIGIVCVGAVCLRRFYLENKKKQDYKSLNYFVDPTKMNLDSQRFPVETHGKEEVRSEASNGPTYSVWVDEGDFNGTNAQNSSTHG